MINNFRIFDFSLEKDKLDGDKLFTSPKIDIIDQYDRFISELIEIRNPRLKGDQAGLLNKKREYIKQNYTDTDSLTQGRWVYYPWSGRVIHILEKNILAELLHARNRNLITPEEQKKFNNAKIGIAGLSTGNNLAMALLMELGVDKFNIADGDILDVTNLNRIRAGLSDVGLKKTEVLEHEMLEYNPYVEICSFDEGVNTKNIDSFFEIDSNKLDVVFEMVDDMEMKVELRKVAKEKGVDLIMLTGSNGGVIVDVERYGNDKRTEIFNGRVTGIKDFNLSKINPKERLQIAGQIAGVKETHPRMLESLNLIGKEIFSWPQVASDVMMMGPIANFITKKIILGEILGSGRYWVDLKKIIKK